MRIIRIAEVNPSVHEDDLVDVVLPGESFRGWVRPRRGTPKGMIVVQNQQTGQRTVVPASACTVNQAWRKRMDELSARREYDEMSRDKETFDRMGHLYQDANP